MPVMTTGQRETTTIQSLSGNTEPLGQRPKWLWETKGRGIPRYDDLMTVRMLEMTHSAKIPIETIIKQITTANFTVRPTVDEPTSEHWDACDEIIDFFQGSYNRNSETFDCLLKQFVQDILTIDAGCIEKVPAEDGYLAELYVRDGATITKNPDEHGRMPPIDSPKPAYYQFNLPMHTSLYANRQPNFVQNEMLGDQGGKMGLRWTGEPVEFTRSQLLYAQENPRSWSVYGYGRLQSVRRVVEILINQDVSNMKYFPEDEVPEGLINVVDANQAEINRFREYWKDEIKGKPHKVGVVGSEIEWIPFRPSPEELEFIESQKWYNKIVWMSFGLNQSEVGDSQQVNRATAKQDARNVFRRTTKPLLNLLDAYLNMDILPFMRPYHRVNGEVEFVFDISSPEIEEIERKRRQEDLQNGLRTINDILKERGEDEVPWGDMPGPVFNQITAQRPEWVIDELLDYDNPPEPQLAGGLMSGEASETKEVSNAQVNDRLTPMSDAEFKEALRNQYGWEGPDLKRFADSMENDVEDAIEDYMEDFEDEVEDAFPKNATTTTKLANVAQAVGKISMVQTLMSAVLPHVTDAMEEGAEHSKSQVEHELLENADAMDEADVNINFDVRDTAAHDRIRKRTGQDMQKVNDTIKQKVNRTLTQVSSEGGNVEDATERLKEEVPEIANNRARLVARTETLQAGRHGTQALCESTSLIEGKKWLSSSDGREREWHGVMNGKIVKKEENFTVPNVGSDKQPDDYPRDAYVPGDDQPFNCRCAEEPVLREDMPEDLKGLEEMDGIKVIRLNSRQKEVYQKRAKDGERFSEMLERIDAEASRNKGARKLNISKTTYYKWLRQFGLDK